MTIADLKQKAMETAKWFESISGRTNGWHWNQANLLRDLVKEIERLEKQLVHLISYESAEKRNTHIETEAEKKAQEWLKMTLPVNGENVYERFNNALEIIRALLLERGNK